MDMLVDFNQQIIPNYSPISARGGSKRIPATLRAHRRRSKKRFTRRNKKSNKSRTRRRYR
jgi:hypothetical protein